MSQGFGLFGIKAEGEPIHPDSLYNNSKLSDDEYLVMLQHYYDAYGNLVYRTECSRPELLKKINRIGKADKMEKGMTGFDADASGFMGRGEEI